MDSAFVQAVGLESHVIFLLVLKLAQVLLQDNVLEILSTIHFPLVYATVDFKEWIVLHPSAPATVMEMVSVMHLQVFPCAFATLDLTVLCATLLLLVALYVKTEELVSLVKTSALVPLLSLVLRAKLQCAPIVVLVTVSAQFKMVLLLALVLQDILDPHVPSGHALPTPA